LLTLHLVGVVAMLNKRRATEAAVVVRASFIALGLVIAQIVIAASMVLMHLPPVLRSLHEATGVGIWLACFSMAYLARRALARSSLHITQQGRPTRPVRMTPANPIVMP
jgi:heme A synthase